MTPVEALRAACDAVVAATELRPEYILKDGKLELSKTFCNLGAQRVAKALACLELDLPKIEENADLLHEIMLANATHRWKKTPAADAVLHAQGHPQGALGACVPGCPGGVAFASMTSKQLAESHGHIAAVRPEPMQMSGSLGRAVPMLANVGRGDPAAPFVDGARAGVKTKRNWTCKASQAFPIGKGEPDYFIYA